MTLLVDASVWIDYLNERMTWATETLEGAFERRLIVIGDLTLMEVLQGVRSRQFAARIERLLQPLTKVEFGGESRARAAAANYRLLRSVGVTPRSAIDVLIATFCVTEGIELLAIDRDFRLMEPVLGLRLAGPALQ